MEASVEPTAADALALGRSALERGEWEGAWQYFSRVVANEESAEALEGLSWSAWWRADAEAVFETRERAYRAYRAAGRDRDAARMAAWVGTDAYDFRGELAIAQGWLRRARTLLDGSEPCVELGWLYVHEAEKKLFSGEFEHGLELGVQASEFGRRFGDVGLEFLGSATEGLARLFQGEFDEGINRLGEATAAALADEFAERWSVGWCCCYMIYGCEQVRDYQRAAQWCRKVEAWVQRLNLPSLTRSCHAHYAGVLIWNGAWEQAESELVECAAQPSATRPRSLSAPDALARLGELRRRQGRFDEAMTLFEQVAEHPLAVLGAGELCLDRGDAAGARHRAEEYLRQATSRPTAARAAGLDLLARAAAAQGDPTSATTAIAELSTVCERIPTDAIRASAAHAQGVVASAQGDRDRARIAFEDAIRYYQRAQAPFEQALAKIALAKELVELGRTADALRLLRNAKQSLARIGPTWAGQEADALIQLLDPSRRPAVLTDRECQVLRLVAGGRTNRAIATELVLSEHTVNRHVTNILTKLDVGSRSAAVAEALRQNLL